MLALKIVREGYTYKEEVDKMDDEIIAQSEAVFLDKVVRGVIKAQSYNSPQWQMSNEVQQKVTLNFRLDEVHFVKRFGGDAISVVAVGKPQLILDQEEADVDTISEIENLEPKMEMKLPKNGQNLASLYPEIAGEWDFELNDLGPDCYFPRSNKTVNWICQLGHRWPAKINNRTTRGSQCPCCSGSKPIRGVNDLETLFPHLAQEWDYTKNDRPPSDFLPKSNVRVNWICKNGHRWDSKIYHRTEGRGCPHCAGLRPIVGENDLETMYPNIAQEWHPTENGNRHPSEFASHSHHEAVWLCPEGHEYPAPIYRRVRGCSCSVCDGKRIIPGINDFATRAPQLAEEWNHAKNKQLSPQMIPLHYNKRVWWKCPKCGHEWQTSPNNRVNNDTECPACAHCTVDPNINSLDVVNPELAKQWDTEKNFPLIPKDVAAYDNRDYFWLCEHGHSWQASPANRNKGTKCPYCAGKKPIVGVNDLESVLPQIALEWHPTRNGDALPEHYLPNSHFEAWWQCASGHEWQKAIYERAYGSNCPVCNKRKTPIRHHI